MKTTIERLDRDHGDFIILSPKSTRRRTRFPFAMLSAMVCAILLMDAILPLRDLWFHEALLTQLGWWPVLPSLILFPGWAVIPPVPQIHATGLPLVIHSWEKVPLLLGAFVVVFLIYLLALRRLPTLVTRRFILKSTLLLGILYALIPIVTSPDVFSYIAYARIGVIHHLNPLTTLPAAIRSDPIYNYLSWIDQPSAYGPTWVIITSAWQWVFTSFGINYILEMIIVLRIQGLAMHLVSTSLIWSISGHLQHLNGNTSSTRRMLATLAFAWNPLLLIEACANAHNDTTLLTLVLLSIWFLTRNAARTQPQGHAPTIHERTWEATGERMVDVCPPRWYNLVLVVRARMKTRLVSYASSPYGSIMLAAAMLALATCLKINVILFVPGLLFYIWAQAPGRDRLKRVVAVSATYMGIIVLLYAPFWQGGAILNVFSVNPATYRSMNSPADFLGHVYNAIAGTLGYPIGEPIGSPAERLTHTLSMGIFVVFYLLLCWRVMRKPGRISTLRDLICWMAVAWLAYCAFGSPWFWPWYIVTFFGLYALIEASPGHDNRGLGSYFVRLLIFSMLSIYCFNAWGPSNSFVPGLPGFEWSYLSGLCAWGLPLIGVALLVRVRGVRMNTGHWS
ncbi:MAG TPA: hypothetical protein VF844_09860 [Ktedonobacteraceae bacterium]